MRTIKVVGTVSVEISYRVLTHKRRSGEILISTTHWLVVVQVLPTRRTDPRLVVVHEVKTSK
jgi:hypothetical protein